jgi:hypothetical protein
MGNHATVAARIHLLKPNLDDAVARMWASRDAGAMYLEWLRSLHGMIRATVPLMTTAIDRCLAMRGDAVAEPVAAYFAKHVREEWGHDEWVREDYLAAGGTEAELDGFVPGPAVAALVGSQYYWIRHAHPVALVGHVAVLEGHPPSVHLADELASRTGLPGHAFRAIARHAHLDVKHRDDIIRLIDGLPLTDRDLSLVCTSALHTTRGLLDVVTEVGRRGAQRAQRARHAPAVPAWAAA